MTRAEALAGIDAAVMEALQLAHRATAGLMWLRVFAGAARQDSDSTAARRASPRSTGEHCRRSRKPAARCGPPPRLWPP